MKGHRVDIEDGPGEVVVRAGDRVVARSRHAKLLHESNLPDRVYVPAGDVEGGLLRRLEKTTHCPFKGDATYWSLDLDGRSIEEAGWSYEEPIAAAEAIRGHVCFDLADALTVERR